MWIALTILRRKAANQKTFVRFRPELFCRSGEFIGGAREAIYRSFYFYHHPSSVRAYFGDQLKIIIVKSLSLKAFIHDRFVSIDFSAFPFQPAQFFIIIISSLRSPSEIIVQSVYIATWGAHVSPQKWSFSELLKFCSIKSGEAKARRWNRLLSLRRSYLPRLYIFRGACVMWVMSLPNTNFTLRRFLYQKHLQSQSNQQFSWTLPKTWYR